MGPKSLRTVTNALAISLLLSPVVLAACTTSETSHLVITQSTDAPAGADHKSHVSPGVFAGITLSIRNTGAGAAPRGVRGEVPPPRVSQHQVDTVGGKSVPAAAKRPRLNRQSILGA